MPIIGSVIATAFSGSGDSNSIVGLSGSLHIAHDGVGNEDGWIRFTELSASVEPPKRDQGRLYCSSSSDTTKLFFKDSAGTESDLLAGGGSDRYVVHRRHYVTPTVAGRYGVLGDQATDGKQFWTQTYITDDAALITQPDVDWLSREVGPTWQAPRDCSLTRMRAVAGINDTSAAILRIWVLKAEPPNDLLWSTQLPGGLVKSGSVDVNPDGGTITAYNAYKGSSSPLTSSFKAGEAAIVAYQAVDNGITTAWVSVTLEFTAD